MEQPTVTKQIPETWIARLRKRTRRRMIVAAVLTSLAGLIGGFNMVGNEAGPAGVLGVFFAGFGGGASLVAAIRQRDSLA